MWLHISRNHKEQSMRLSKNILGTLSSVLLAIFILGSSATFGQDEVNISTVKSADGSVINYGVQGAGDVTIVFVHCWTCDHEFWTKQIDHFAKTHRVVWLDLAGHGSSMSKRKDYTMAAFGQDVAAVVNEVGADKVILVGHSMGGPVSIEAANQLGDKVIGIVGVDTFYTPFDYPTSEEKIEGFVKPFKEDFAKASEQMVRSMFVPDVNPAVKEYIVHEFADADPDMGVSAMYDIFHWSAKNVPGTLDKYGKRLRNINGAPKGDEKPLHDSVVLIPHVGHFVAQVKPEEFNKVLEEIVAGFGVK